MSETNKKKSGKMKKITLKGYYKNLPEGTFPKRDFVNEAAVDCKVSTATVRNWIDGRTKPDNPEHVKYLSKKTGIPVEDLWKE